LIVSDSFPPQSFSPSLLFSTFLTTSSKNVTETLLLVTFA
jgi:hypothetical protein